MLGLENLFLLALCSSPVLSIPLIPKRQCVDECGSTCYFQSDIDAAVQSGCQLLQTAQTVGGKNRYPHVYNDFEAFAFPDSGPYYEFPILKSGIAFSGDGGPGPDRVIFTPDCAYEGVVTHTGASGNDFLLCVPIIS